MPNISKFALKDGKITKSMSKIKSFTSCFLAFHILLLGISHPASRHFTFCFLPNRTTKHTESYPASGVVVTCE